jgi:hypothetical protein
MNISKQEAGKLGALKTKALHEQLNAQKKTEYYQNPIICKHCGGPHTYEKRNNKFCDISCATSFNNKLKIKTKYNCLNCGINLLGNNKKYCNAKCQQEKQIDNKIKNGTVQSRTIKKVLLKEHGEKCWCCGITEWNGKKITFELEHIDGNSNNNSLDNLSILCPNCHSQTATYKAKNKGNGRHNRRIRYTEGKSF